MTPTEAMDRPAWQFWMDARIRAAGTAWENDARQQAQNGSDVGAATEAEKEDLVAANEQRADRKEQMDGSAPELSDQLAALKDQSDPSNPGGDV